MPDPKEGESKQEYISRCVVDVMNEGKDQNQALGQCFGMWASKKSEQKILEKEMSVAGKEISDRKDITDPDEVLKYLRNYLVQTGFQPITQTQGIFWQKSIDDAIAVLQKVQTMAEEEELIAEYEPELLDKAMTVDGFESPEPGDLPEEGKKILAKVYAKCRKDGGNKEKCAKIAWGAVNNAGYKSENKIMILKRIEKAIAELVKIRKDHSLGTRIDKAIDDLIVIEKGRKLQGRKEIQGLNISIENKKGSKRKGVDQDGKEWEIIMPVPYGYIRMTEGADGEHVDCFIGENQDSEKVWIVKIQNPKTKEYDEDKIFLGFNSDQEVMEVFNKSYDRNDIFQSISEMTMADFKKALSDRKGIKIKKAWQIASGKWHDYDSAGNVVDVPAPGQGSGKGSESDESQGKKESKKYEIDHSVFPENNTTKIEMNSIQRRALEAYTDTHHDAINTGLRKGKKDLLQNYDSDIKAMDQVMNNSRIEKDIMVWRGIDLVQATDMKISDFKVGKIIKDKGFMSTTREKEKTGLFDSKEKGEGNFLKLEISVPKGTKGIDINQNHIHPDSSSLKDEKEVLLNRNTKMKIKEVDVENMTIKCEVIHAKQ